jgi:iron-sulfur cluster assembly protein
MFMLTSAAADQVRRYAAFSGTAEFALRVAARREADGSITYGMGFDNPGEGEAPALQFEGVTVLIAPGSRGLLEGTVLDYVEMEPGEHRFIFIPDGDAQAGSGCGTGGCGSCGSGCGAS